MKKCIIMEIEYILYLPLFFVYFGYLQLYSKYIIKEELIMFFIDELKNFKLYKKQFLYPIVDNDKKHGSLVFIFSPIKIICPLPTLRNFISS